jgi:hypothetical protein
MEQAVGGLVAVVRFLLQQVQDDRGQHHRYGRVHLRRRHRDPGQMIMDEAQRVAGAEGRRPRRQLVQSGAQRVQVRALVHRPAGAPGLLRRQVGHRADDLGVVGEFRADLGEGDRQREVHQGRRAVVGQHDVRWGDVAVHHPTAVHPRHRPGQCYPQPGQFVTDQRLCRRCQVRVSRVRNHERPRVLRRIQQLHEPVDPAEALQHRHLVPQPVLGVRTERLLADDGALGEEQPAHPRAIALVDHVGPNGPVVVRQSFAWPHPAPPPNGWTAPI